MKKTTKNPRVILADSALSFAKKRTILTQEGLRRLRNTKVDLGPEVQKLHLNRFMLKLKNSGYNQKFRTEVLDSILKAFQEEDDKNEVKPIFRSREWNADEREKLKAEKKFNWWNNKEADIQYTSVLFGTLTPGGSWPKKLEKEKKN